MAVQTCPSCGNPLTREEYEARHCPACQMQGIRPASEVVPPARPERVVSAPPRERPSTFAAPAVTRDWSSVRTGLLMAAIGSLIVGVAFLGEMLTYKYWILPQGQSEQAREHLFRNQQLLRIFSNLFYGGGAILLMGVAMAVGSPAGTGTRPWVLAAVGCLGVALVLVYAGDWAQAENMDWEFNHPPFARAPADQSPRDLPWGKVPLRILGYSALILVLAGNVLFGLFLVQAARAWRRPVLVIGQLVYLIAAFAFQLVSSIVVINQESLPQRRNATHLNLVFMGDIPNWLYVVGLLSVLWFAGMLLWAYGALVKEGRRARH
jgi:hypothetical protein